MRPFGLSPHSLPIHPQLREDELLSSWLVRLAWANRMKVHSLTVRMAENSTPVWNRDIDRMVPEWLLFELEKLVGVPAGKVRGAGLTELAGSLVGGPANITGSESWLLPLGVWHRKRRRFGVQYCPLCLQNPKGQYIRRAWRISFCTECDVHNVLFHDRCYACAAPVTYFRQDFGDRAEPGQLSLANCSGCGAALYRAPAHRAIWPSNELRLAVWTLCFMKDFGWTVLDGRVFESSWSLFRVLRQMIRVMSSNRANGQLYDAVAEMLWPEGYHVLGNRGAPYEDRGVVERHRLFAMATWLLTDWPNRFRSMVKASGIGYWCLVENMKDPPEWYASEYRRLLGRKSE